MPSESVRLLLDEHYPAWLAADLEGEGVDARAVTGSPALRSADDVTVLRAAVADGRVVVTEDITTFAAAVAQVPDHLGVVYCHPVRWPRTRAGLHRVRKALVALVSDPPEGLGQQPIVWWL